MTFRAGQLVSLAVKAAVAATVALSLMILAGLPSRVSAGPSSAGEPPLVQVKKAGTGSKPGNPAPAEVGLLLNDRRAFQGYTLIAPMISNTTYLIDMQGRVVRTWESDCNPGVSAYLLENGHLLRPGAQQKQAFGFGPGAGGRVQEFTWEGNLVWNYTFASEKRLPHHDVTRLPNGNVLMIVWEKKTADEAVAAGRRADLVGTAGLHPDYLMEVKPTGKTTGEIVWEWHLWDHLVQDHDRLKPNFDNVSAHPELVDINFGSGEGPIAPMMANKDGIAKLRSLGYIGNTPVPASKDTTRGEPEKPAGPAPKDLAQSAAKEKQKGALNSRRPPQNADWTHINAVAYNPDLDQIIVSVHAFSEIWVLDHSTTTAEAASHKGGRSGKGGDLLYRWGNPRAYRSGSKTEQQLFNQHNAHWIGLGLSGESHILVFNNGSGRPGGPYSSVDEIVPPVDSQGQYARSRRGPYGPDKPVWSYSAPKKSDFYSFFISGAQRLPNGNTLICTGASGVVFEVTPEKEVVWRYANPVKGGPGGFGGNPGGVDLLPFFLRNQLNLSPDQRRQIDQFQERLRGQLEKVLSTDQLKHAREVNPFGPGGFAALPLPGQLISAATTKSIKPTAEQTKQLDDLQKEADGTLDKLLNADQKKDFHEVREGFARGGPFGARPPGGPGGPPPGGPSPGGPGGPMGNTLFRAYRYGADFPGLLGKDLKPGKAIEALEDEKKPKEPAKK
jgi:Arylsulfotransferase (ASST)